jgi:hypothetical protein
MTRYPSRRDRACSNSTLRRCVEEPNVFLYRIEWESLARHVWRRTSPLVASLRGAAASPVPSGSR